MLEEEIVVKAIDLDVRVVKAKDSETETEKLIIEFTPFLRSRVARYSARYDEYQRDTLFSTAMLAFHEAILNFNIEMGRFLPYAERVIRSRIIDNIREMNRKEGNTIPLFEDNDELNSAESPAIREISMRKYEADLRQEMLA
ncbi:MAG: hypothetical protein FWG53_01700, partial [Clostridiales bacterium]|nr:hypothetical protein [Clostridiales bacterium]